MNEELLGAWVESRSLSAERAESIRRAVLREEPIPDATPGLAPEWWRTLLTPRLGSLRPPKPNLAPFGL